MGSARDYDHPAAQMIFRPAVKDSEPLFQSVASLSRSISEKAKTTREYQGDPQNIPAILGQFFRGRGRLPKALADDVLAVVRERARSGSGLDLEQLALYVHAPKGTISPVAGVERKGGRRTVSVVERLFEYADTAKQQVIFTSTTAEDPANQNVHALRLQGVLLKRYGLLREAKDPSPTDVPRYLFYLPPNSAEPFWRRLRQELVEHPDRPVPEDEALQRLREANEYLRVYEIAASYCVPPVVYFVLDNGRKAMFCIAYHGEKDIDVAQMNDIILSDWTSAVYDRLGTDTTRKEITVADIFGDRLRAMPTQRNRGRKNKKG